LRSTHHGFLFSDGNYTTFDVPFAIGITSPQGINSAGQIVGRYLDRASQNHGFLLDGGSYTGIDVPGALQSVAMGINSSGQISGLYATNAILFPRHGFLFKDGNYTGFDVPNP